MKSTNRTLGLIALFLLLLNLPAAFSQDTIARPKYITVTTMHWNMDQKDFEMDAWKSVEKEYLDKVTSKNGYVMSAAFYLHQFTADNTEVVYVQSYASWEDIDKASKTNDALEKAVWADENTRKSFFKKRNNYYSTEHSDEIYATFPGAKLMAKKPDKNMVLYVRKSHLAFPVDGDEQEFNTLIKEGMEHVVHKNEYIKAYYPYVHAWGADRTEFVEAFLLDSLADIVKMIEKTSELNNAKWTDENTRNTRRDKMRKYFTGVHGDYIYTAIAGLSK